MHTHHTYSWAKSVFITLTTLVTIALSTSRAHATDTTPPVISGVPANTTVECSAVPAAASPTATDDTDPNPSISLNESSTQSASGCSHSNYILTRTWTASDSSGNTSTAVQQITVHD